MAATPCKENHTKITYFLDAQGRSVLHYVFTCGTPNKLPTVSLKEYLKKLPPGSTANYWKVPRQMRDFNQIEKLKVDGDPSCGSFDISLLFKVIKLVCERVAGYNSSVWQTPGTLEHYATTIKNRRNDHFHGEQTMTQQHFQTAAAEYKQLFVATLTAAKVRYNRPDAELSSKLQEVEDSHDQILKKVLGEEELLLFCGKRLAKDLIQEADLQVRQILQNAVYIDPMSFLNPGAPRQLHVQTVFCKIKLKAGQRGREGEEIEHTNLLSLVQPKSVPLQQQGVPGHLNPSWPQLLLVEGLAGSGKTTLVTFILSEWLKSDNTRILKGLNCYDLLLRIQCRDHDSSSLQDLLQKVMPEAFLKYKSLLLPLLKLCQVLFLVDGLDESNDSSNQLVQNILAEGKDVPGFTVVCTSRPENLEDFQANTPAQYQSSHVELVGVPQSERTNFVLKYYRWLSQQAPGNIEHLTEIMKGIEDREQFRLPLNLLFVAWVYHHDRDAITTTTTQTQLYYSAHQMCVKKLLDRLARHSSTSRMSPSSRQDSVQKVLEVLYRVSLGTLCRKQLFLVKQDLDSLKLACDTYGLPHQEVLSAFLTLRATWTYLGVKEQYSAPHKGLQDFCAALHVAAQPSLTASGSIMDILRAEFGTQEPDLSNLQNVFIHLAGLLHRQHSLVPGPLAQEVVDLLQESQVSTQSQWFDLLEETGLSQAFLQPVAHRFSANTTDLSVIDGRVECITALLPLLPPCTVDIEFTKNMPDLNDLVQTMGHHTCNKVSCNSHFRDPRPAVTTDQALQQILPRSILTNFSGFLSGEYVGLLPPSLQCLWLVVLGADHARRLLAALTSTIPRLPNLVCLVLHVPVKEAVLDALIPISSTSRTLAVCLLSGVDDQLVAKACLVAKALQPSSGYWQVNLPQSSMSVAGWRRLLEGLAEAGVKVAGQLSVLDTNVPEDQMEQLENLAETAAKYHINRSCESLMWGVVLPIPAIMELVKIRRMLPPSGVSASNQGASKAMESAPVGRPLPATREREVESTGEAGVSAVHDSEEAVSTATSLASPSASTSGSARKRRRTEP